MHERHKGLASAMSSALFALLRAIVTLVPLGYTLGG